MNRILKDIMDSLFACFKSYRKKIGGTWYFIYDPEDACGHASTTEFWSRDLPNEEYIVLKKEIYP